MKKHIFLISIMLISFSIIFSCSSIQALYEVSISAKSGILIEAKTGKVLYSKNEKERLPMASTTKIMTSLIALEQQNLHDEFVVDSDAIKVEGSSMGLLEGDIVDLIDLSYGMMLPSGNDAANAVAVRISGSVEKFLDVMNSYAKNIGLNDTNFVTPSGLHDKDHYSTSYDMAMLMRKAMQNSRFREITSKSSALVNFGNPSYDRTLQNHNKLLNMYEGAVGGKTGFTTPSGRCLVSVAERNGLALIAVTLNSPDDWNDHIKMYDYGFGSNQLIDLDFNINGLELNVTGGVEDYVGAKLSESPKAYIDESQKSKVKHRVFVKPFYYAPINEGDVLGEVEFSLNDDVIYTVPIISNNSVDQLVTDVEDSNIFEKIKEIVTNIFNKIRELFN